MFTYFARFYILNIWGGGGGEEINSYIAIAHKCVFSVRTVFKSFTSSLCKSYSL